MGASEQRTAEQMADELGEKDLAREKILHIANQCGLEFTNELFEQTLRIEQEGGLMVKDRSRRRTPGGVFFYLVKERLKEERRFEDLDKLFPQQPREQSHPQPPPLVPRMRPRPRAGTAASPSAPAAQPRPTSDGAGSPPSVGSGRGRTMDQHQAMETVRSALGDACYKVSANVQEQTMTVRFLFPEVARPQYAEAIETLKARTGWDIVIHPLPHQGKLAEVARQVLPPSLLVLGDPSIHQNERVVMIRCHEHLDEAALLQARERFQAATGWDLQVRIVA